MTGFTRLNSITLVTTNRCNLRCKYCYQDREDKTDMSWEIAKAGLDLLFEASRERMAQTNKPESLTVLFYGGEPVLTFDLMEQAVAYTREHAPQGACKWS